MHRIGWKPLVGIVAMATLLVTAWTARAQEPSDPGRVDKIASRSFSKTLAAIEKAVESEGMMIVAKIDHKNMIAMVGTKIEGATTIEFGKPSMMKMLLPMNPAIGLEMPLKIYVYESPDGKVIVSYRKIAPQCAVYGNPEVAKAGEMMDMMLEKIASTATK